VPEVEAELARRLERGEEVLLATVIGLDGDPPSRSGAKLLLAHAAPLAGTLGCAEFDSAALADAQDLLAGGRPALRTYRHDLGSIQVYLEPYPAQPVLLVAGATPVAAALVRWGRELGFRPVLFESRTERLGGEPWKDVTILSSVADLRGLPRTDLYAVHTDHDAPDLVDAVRALLERGPRFLGLMGSRRHTGHHLERLQAEGVSDTALGAIMTPVGLPIGAQGPAEIALSILAAVVAARRDARAG
jgi:xanthine/CO dehydrogenase XdhC/CoxF family maturation factor